MAWSSSASPATAAVVVVVDGVGIPHRNERTGPAVARIASAGVILARGPGPPVPASTRGGSLRTDIPDAPNVTVTVPSRSVRNVLAPAAASRSSVTRDGWPYGFPAPAEATAIRGRTAAMKASVVAVRLP